MADSDSDSPGTHVDRNTYKGVDEKSTPQRARGWLFVINNYDSDSLDSALELMDSCTHFSMQEEIGENGTPHLQGGCRFKCQRTFKQMKQKLPTAHLEIAKNINAVLEYSKKTKTRNGRVWTKEPEKIKDPIETPREWQKTIIEELKEEADDRTVNWICDLEGNSGKTALCKHLCLKGDAILVGGKASDVKAAIASMKVKPRIVLWNIPRSLESYVSYESIESVKDGI